MFPFFKTKKKNIDTQQINTFNSALKVIEDFILFEEFESARVAINEVKSKENESFKIFIEKIGEDQKKKELENFRKKLLKLEKLDEKLDGNKKNHEKKLKEKTMQIEKDSLKKQLKAHISQGNFTQSLFILNNYLEKYKENFEVINYVNREKNSLNKLIEKNKKIREKEIKKDAFLEARELIGEIQNNINDTKKNASFFAKFVHQFNIYGKIKKKLREKRLMEEVNILLQQQNEKNDITARSKLAMIHSGVLKEIAGESLDGYELYGKIIGADKISGDTLGFYNTKNNYRFFIGDATGHGIKAGFIITQLTKNISEIINLKSLEKIVFEINNALKQELKSGNFITSIFFDIEKKNIDCINFIGMGHEPIFVFRKKTQTVEKIIPGGLAAGIRIIKEISSIKKKSIFMEDGDILISYSDGIAEARSPNGEMYSIDRMGKKLEEFGKNAKYELHDMYQKFIEDLRDFTGGQVNYYDDVSIILLKRDKNKEIIQNQETINKLLEQEGIPKNKKVKAKGKTIEEIRDEIEKIKKESALKNIIRSLDILYKTGEIPKLKQDAIRYIKEGYIDKKINFYLKKALDSEHDFKIKQKNKKIEDKYNVLRELYKKGDYETVVLECSNIITKDGNL